MMTKALFSFLACVSLTVAARGEPVFRAGAVTTDISPTTFPRIIAGGFLEGRGERLASRLYSRAIVLDDGKMQIAFAIVDTCMMDQKLIDEAKALASRQCGIPVDRMMVSATHTHSAPAAMGCLGTRKDEEYAKFLTPKIAESIIEAHKRLQPARIGWAAIDDWEHTHNRRWIRLPGKEVVDPFGEATGRANMHPGYLSKDVVGPSGPVDPQLSVISIQTKSGQPLAVLANYSQHYFGQSPVSADYFGLFCQSLAKKMNQPDDGNGPFVCAMSQGTSGDLMWMDYGAEKKSFTIESYAEGVASSAHKALQDIQYHDHAPLGMVEKTLDLKYRVPDEKRLAWARPIAAKIGNDVPKNKEEVYAREALILHERQKTTVKLQAIRIGDLSIATLPNEVYAITGLKLRAKSPLGMHFNIELANGAEGYIPPMEQHTLGGYTTWPARTAGLEVKAEPQMVDQLSKSIVSLADEKKRQPGELAGPYAVEIHSANPLAYFGCGQTDGSSLVSLINGETQLAKFVGAHAFYLPGVGSGLGYDSESALTGSAFSSPKHINRSIHLAGGHLETSNPKLGTHSSIALWFWLGHESGASDRSGELINALGVSLKAHQFPDHTVQLEWSAQSSVRNERPQTPDAAQGTVRTTFADDWHFAVLIRDGENVRVHLDGSEKPVLTKKAGKAANEVLFGQGLEGRLDEITIWDRVIEPSLIAKLWNISKVGEENANRAVSRAERKKRGAAVSAVQKDAVQRTAPHSENWSASMRFKNTKANNVSAVTAYLISRGPKGDSQAPGDHLGIGGNYKDSSPGRLFVFNGNAADQIVRGTTEIEPGTWNDVKLERLGSRVKVILNGKVEIDAELPVTAPGAKELFFGRRCDDFAPLEGTFEKVEVAGLEVGRAVPSPPREANTPANTSSAASKPNQPAAALSEKAPYHEPPLSPEESAKKWHVREGYRIELVAAEPVVLDPVAFDWDEQGRLWVIEMADYPLGMDGNGKAGGRVVRLEDTDNDGRYDKRHVIVSNLSYPTGILTWREGIIVTAAPDIFFISPDGTKKVLYTGFSTGNQQLRVNGLRWGMDGWVYCAAGAHHGGYNKGAQIECKLTGEKIDLGSRDFRFKPDTGEFDPQTGPSQFGRARDDWGHWFGVQNSFPLWHYVLQDHYLRRNPHVIPPDPIHQLFPRNPPVYPASSMEKRFHSFDQAGRFTSACGIEVYRDVVLFESGAAVPAAQSGAGQRPAPHLHAFTCEPFHNVVQHHVLEDDGVTFKAVRDPAESKMDFLASEDRWCRPVMVRTGPDGALWVADMYRYMIEHPQWLPQNGKEELLPHYREGDDKGRIWRVVRSSHLAPRTDRREIASQRLPGGGSEATANEHTASKSGKASGKRSVPFISTERDDYFASPNGWLRDKAQMMALWDRPEAEIQLTRLTGAARAQAAWTLLALGKLKIGSCLDLLEDQSPRVREQALQMAEHIEWKGEESEFEKALTKLSDDRDKKVRLQLACSLGEWPGQDTTTILTKLLQQDGKDPVMLGALLSSATDHLAELAQEVPDEAFLPLVSMAIHAWDEDALTNLCDRMMIHNEFKDSFVPRLRLLQRFLLAAQSQGTTISTMSERARREQLKDLLHSLMNGHVNAAMTVPWDWEDAPLADVIAMGEIPLLVPGREAEGREMLKNWLKFTRPSLQEAAVTLMGRHPKPETDDLLVAKLATATPILKQTVVEALLTHESGAVRLLTEIKTGGLKVVGLMDAATQGRLINHPNKEMRQLAATVFADSTSASRAAVVEKFKPALKLQGDAARGKTVFASVCISCHKLDGVGLELGPDLRSVAQHDAEKLLNSILDPSAIIEPGFMAYHCTLKSGEQLYGVISTETSASLTLKMAGNIPKSVLRSEIKELKATQNSLMPDGLEAALTAQSLADLIAYLKKPQ